MSCMGSLTQWTWIWASSERRWRTGKPGVGQSMESWRVGLNWATEQQQQRVLQTSQVAQWSRTSLPMQETQVWSLGLEDPLEEEMSTPSSVLAWKIPWREEPGGLQSMGSQTVRHSWAYTQDFYTSVFTPTYPSDYCEDQINGKEIQRIVENKEFLG